MTLTELLTACDEARGKASHHPIAFSVERKRRHHQSQMKTNMIYAPIDDGWLGEIFLSGDAEYLVLAANSNERLMKTIRTLKEALKRIDDPAFECGMHCRDVARAALREVEGE